MRSAGCSCAEGGDSLVSGSTDIGTTPFRRPGSVYWRQGPCFSTSQNEHVCACYHGPGQWGDTREKIRGLVKYVLHCVTL